jgi:hypothetical protein
MSGWQGAGAWSGLGAVRPAWDRRAQIGVGDGAQTTFPLPAGTVAVDLTVGGLPQPGSNHAISRGTGPSGADQLVFTSAPAVGEPVEAMAWVR